MSVKCAVFILVSLYSGITCANVLCTATSDSYPDIKDGLIFSKSVALTGAQGTKKGHQTIYEDKEFEYRLVTGRVVKTGSLEPKIVDFYTELKIKDSKKSPIIVRAKSGMEAGIMQARLELVDYPENSYLYKGILLFECKYYL